MCVIPSPNNESPTPLITNLPFVTYWYFTGEFNVRAMGGSLFRGGGYMNLCIYIYKHIYHVFMYVYVYVNTHAHNKEVRA